MSATFKVFFSQENIRRLKFSVLPSYQEFIDQLKEIHPSFFYGKRKFLVKYVDSDEDFIAVSSEIEWLEMISELSSNPYFKLYIEPVEDTLEQEDSMEQEDYKELNCPLLGGCQSKCFSLNDCQESECKERSIPKYCPFGFGFRRFFGCKPRVTINRCCPYNTGLNGRSQEEDIKENSISFEEFISNVLENIPQLTQYGDLENPIFWKLHKLSYRCL